MIMGYIDSRCKTIVTFALYRAPCEVGDNFLENGRKS